MQMNRRAFEFHNLRASEGSVIDWEKVDYFSGRVPVMLGDAYRGIYDVGSTFEGEVYFLPVTFEVVGFLPADASMYFFGEFNYYLDHHILVPYPPRLEGCVEHDAGFCGLLVPATINTDFVVPKDMSSEEVLTRLGDIGSASGFDSYELASVPPYLTQLSFMRKLVENNAGLLQAFEALAAALAAFVLVVVNRHLTRRRSEKAKVWTLLGGSRASVEKRMWALRCVEYALAGALLIVAMLRMPHQNYISMFAALGVLVCAIVLEAMTSGGGQRDLAR